MSKAPITRAFCHIIQCSLVLNSVPKNSKPAGYQLLQNPYGSSSFQKPMMVCERISSSSSARRTRIRRRKPSSTAFCSAPHEK